MKHVNAADIPQEAELIYNFVVNETDIQLASKEHFINFAMVVLAKREVARSLEQSQAYSKVGAPSFATIHEEHLVALIPYVGADYINAQRAELQRASRSYR